MKARSTAAIRRTARISVPRPSPARSVEPMRKQPPISVRAEPRSINPAASPIAMLPSFGSANKRTRSLRATCHWNGRRTTEPIGSCARNLSLRKGRRRNRIINPHAKTALTVAEILLTGHSLGVGWRQRIWRPPVATRGGRPSSTELAKWVANQSGIPRPPGKPVRAGDEATTGHLQRVVRLRPIAQLPRLVKAVGDSNRT